MESPVSTRRGREGPSHAEGTTLCRARPEDRAAIVAMQQESLRALGRGWYGEQEIEAYLRHTETLESYLVEDGKITAPLKGVNLIGNGPDVLRKVSMLGHDVETSDGIWTCGKDGQSVPVGVGCPTIKISSITVGGTKV